MHFQERSLIVVHGPHRKNEKKAKSLFAPNHFKSIHVKYEGVWFTFFGDFERLSTAEGGMVNCRIRGTLTAANEGSK